MMNANDNDQAEKVEKAEKAAAPVAHEERKRPKNGVPEEKRAQALELFKHGIGYTRASRILNISVNTARDWSREFRKGSFNVKVAENQYRYPKSVRENVIRLRLSGLSWSEVHKRTGICVSTARKWVAEYCTRRGVRPQLLVPHNSSMPEQGKE